MNLRKWPAPRGNEEAGQPQYRNLFPSHDISQHTTPTPPTNVGFAEARNQFLLGVLRDPALRLRATEIRVAALIGMYASHPLWRERGELYAWPSVQFLSETLELKIQTVHKALDALVHYGHIELVGRRYKLFVPTKD